jgi:WD40 repeat protein
MGVVYRARHVRLDRLVALKMIRAGDLADADELARFADEARAVARLQHPHVVQVYEIGEHDGRPFFSLEYVAGGSLARRLAGTPQPARDAAALVETLARAMHHAHRQGIVHRDLKPANVLLSADGMPKIADFGLAKRLEDAGRTRAGAVLGTPSYMAPEQASGAKDVGPPADVYALGALLYECLTGRPPFRAPTVPETLEQVRTQEPVPPRQLQPTVPRDVETICLKCLRKEPARRYAGAEPLADDLRRFLDGGPIQTRPVGGAERLWRWYRRDPVLANLLVLLVLLLLGGTVGATWEALWQRHLTEVATKALAGETAAKDLAQQNQRAADDNARRARQGELAAEANAERARRGELAARREAYFSQMSWAREYWARSEIEEVQRRLAALRPPAEQEDLRGFEWYYLQRLCHAGRLTLVAPAFLAGALSFSPDGQALTLAATRGAVGEVHSWDTRGGAERAPPRRLGGRVAFHGPLALSPDGKRLAAAGLPGMVRVWDLDTGQVGPPLQAWPASAGRGVGSLAFSADGLLLAAGGGQTGMPAEVVVWDLRTGKKRATLPGHMGDIVAVAFAPDGKRLASGSWDVRNKAQLGEVRVWDLDGATVRDTIPTWATALTFSPDGRLLASVNGPFGPQWGAVGEVKLWDPATGRPWQPQLQNAIPGGGSSIAFSPDGGALAVGRYDSTVKVWDVATGRELATLKGHIKGIARVAFSPDRATLASLSGEGVVKVWDVPTRPVRPPGVAENLPAISAVAFTPDGKAFATGEMNPAAVRLWQAATGRQLAVLGKHGGTVRAVAFTPDGRILASGGEDGIVKLWDLTTRRERATLGGHQGMVTAVAFAPDNRTLASAEEPGHRVKLWDTATGRELDTVEGGAPLAFSPDGRALAHAHPGANGQGGEFRLTDLATRRVRARITVPRLGVGPPHGFLGVSPDGTLVAGRGPAGEVKVWDVATATERITLGGDWRVFSNMVGSVAFSPDGKVLASAPGNSPLRTGPADFIKLWDLATGKELYTLEGLTAPAFFVAFSPDGRTLVSGSTQLVPNGIPIGDIRVWRGATDDELEAWSRGALARSAAMTRASGALWAQNGAGVFLPRIPGEVTDNGNDLVRRHYQRLTFDADPMPPGLPPRYFVDGDVAQSAWPQELGADAGQGRKSWFQVTFPEAVAVRRVTVLGSRYAGNGLRAATLKLYDAGGKLLRSRECQAEGDCHDCDWRFDPPVEGVTRVRFVVGAEQEGDHPPVAIAQFLAE